jgi:serine/threonine protein kinase
MKGQIKIIDFGFARYLKNEELAYSTLGSPINMDPGILQKLNKATNFKNYGYDEKADIWSLGTIFYELLIGKNPYDSESMKELLHKVSKGTYFIPKILSKEAVSFINCMLQIDPKRRLSADKLYNHKFLRLSSKEFNKIDLKEVKKKLKGSKIQINAIKNESIWDIFGEGVIESIIEEKDEEETHEKKELASTFDALTQSTFFISNSKSKFHKNPKVPPKIDKNNIEKAFLNAFREINLDSVSIEPKIIPFIPGLDPYIENIDYA